MQDFPLFIAPPFAIVLRDNFSSCLQSVSENDDLQIPPRAPSLMPSHQVLCIGSALWDIIARTGHAMSAGADMPGQISKQMGGVALNIALALVRRGQSAAILSAIGQDAPGDELMLKATKAGVNCAHILRTTDPTDTYLAIEDVSGEVFGAIADCASLEREGDAILEPLRDGTLAGKGAPWRGRMVIDGNLPEALLIDIAGSLEFHFADLAFVPASPGKAARLREVIKRFGHTIYVNRGEAEIICRQGFATAEDAARGLKRLGANKAIVTDGANRVAQVDASGVFTLAQRPVDADSVTGAGDTFLAAHIAAEIGGQTGLGCLQEATRAARDHITRGGT